MFCANCGKQIADGSSFCSFCGYAVGSCGCVVPGSSDPGAVADRVRKQEIFVNVLWLVVGIVQIFLVYTAIAGVWNIVNSILCLCNSKNIVSGNPNVIPYFKNRKTGLIIIGVVNLLIGGVVGIALVAYELHIRQVVLDNAAAFSASCAKPRANRFGTVEIVCSGCSEKFTVNYDRSRVKNGIVKFVCPKCKTKANIHV